MSVRLRLMGMGLVLFVATVFAYARNMPWHWLTCTALGFSWLGDAMLLRYPPIVGRTRDPLTLGMGAFALAQVAYVVAFAWSLSAMPGLHTKVPGMLLGKDLIGSLLPVFLLFGVLCWVLLVFRTQQGRAVKVAVLLYGELLCAMAAYATAAAFTGVNLVWSLPLGGILFIISDGVIAAHTFQGRFANEKRYEIIVWATYVPAQLLLLLGMSLLH